MKLTVILGKERFELNRPPAELTVYLRHRIRSHRDPKYEMVALDGAAIRLSYHHSVIASGPGYLVHRDGHIVKAYHPNRWYEAVDLFMVLVELVPRDQKEVT